MAIVDRLRARPHLLAFALFSWIVFLHLAGLSLFTRGFLLTRLALPNTSSCSPSFESPCTLPPTHKRAVVLIIDALRFDFIAPASALPALEKQSEFYHNVLTLPRELSVSQPYNSFIFNAHSDPPTATLQRIKGLTTGSLPTFIDIGASFSASAIEEDSLVSQLKAAGKRIAFAGDDTWLSVFKGDSFERNMSWPYDSFNVEDLHSVDEGVLRHLFPLLQQESGSPEWDVFIGHFLGVDHVGHRLGPDHPTMRAKLTQMDSVLRQVVASLDDETLLVVLGDHGMDAKGDHGGDGLLETSSALWIYSKSVPLSSTFENGRELDVEVDNVKTRTTFPGAKDEWRSVQQIDLVPTLSLLLGLPIPFGNLGTVIPELFTARSFPPFPSPSSPTPSHSEEAHDIPAKKKSWWRPSSPPASEAQQNADNLNLHSPPSPPNSHLHPALAINAHQISSYLSAYRSSSSGAELDPFWDSLLSSSVKALAYDAENEDHEHYVQNVLEYTRGALETCRGLWARFSTSLMVLGLVLLGGSLASTALIYGVLAQHRQNWTVVASELVMRAWTGVGIGFIASALGVGLGLTRPSWAADVEGRDIVLLSSALVSEISILGSLGPSVLLTWSARIFPSTLAKSNMSPKRPSFQGTILPLALLTLHSLSFFSNSFILWEDRLVPYFLFTLLLPFFLSSALSAPTRQLRTRLSVLLLILALIIRVSSTSTVCREEQHPYCSVTFYASSTRPLAPVGIALIVVPMALALPWIIRKAFLEKSLSDKGPAGVAIDVMWRMGLLGGSTYWIVEWVESVFGVVGDGEEGKVWWIGASLIGRTVLARIVLGGTLVGGYVFWWNTALNIEIQVSEEGLKKKVTVLGFANAFGSAYLLFILPFFALLWTATQLSGQVVLALGLGAVLCWVEVVDGTRDVRELIESFESAENPQAALDAVSSPSPQSLSSSSSNLLSSPSRSTTLSEPIFLALLSHLIFFATGHQAVLSSIQWKSAFVGFPILSYPWSPALVSLNTFGPFALFAGLVPPLYASWAISPVQPAHSKLALEAKLPPPTVPVLQDALRIALGVQIYFGALLLGTASSAAILSRHLMVWKVFAPRFMLAGVGMLVVDAALAVGVFGGLRKVVKKVESVFGPQI